jgi:HPr kinase/phosphorylase
MEIRGMGIVHVPSLFGVASMRLRMKLDLIVELRHQRGDDDVDRTGLTPRSREILGREIPILQVPVGPGRDISLIVEVAAMNQKLKQLGHDAAKELDERLISRLLNRANS